MKRSIGNRLIWIERMQSLSKGDMICHLAEDADAEESICGLEFGELKMVVRGIPPREYQCRQCLDIRERENEGGD